MSDPNNLVLPPSDLELEAEESVLNDLTLMFVGSPIQGPRGEQGPAGESGTNGQSAYQTWLQAGNTGTEAAFLASLKGHDGTNGTDGVDGPRGPAGESAYEQWIGLGHIGTLGDFLASLTGAKGDVGDIGLKGDKGDKGDPGTGLTNRSTWLSGTTYDPNSYVFDTGADGHMAMWIYRGLASFVSTVHPKDDLSNWIGFEAPAGANGVNGVNGSNGADGADGKSVELQKTGTAIQWRQAGGAWADLVLLSSLTGSQGAKGDPGASAYQAALDNGFSGTLAAWLTSLMGAKGDKGDKGDAGTKGDKGDRGDPGADGTATVTVYATSGPPSAALGNSGDIAIDAAAMTLYGPKGLISTVIVDQTKLTPYTAATSYTPTFTAGHGVQNARATASVTTGKWYFEVQVLTANASSSNAAVGLVPPSYALDWQLGYDGNGTTGLGAIGVFQGTGNVYRDGGSSPGISAPFQAQNTFVCVAFDAAARLVWFRDNNGNWNNSASANPTTGVGGYSVGGTTPLIPAVCSDNNAAFSFNFGLGAFQYALPSGFQGYTTAGTSSGAWPVGVSLKTAVNPVNLISFFPGVPTSTVRLLSGITPQPTTFPVGLTGSYAYCFVAPAANVTLTINKVAVNGTVTALGTINFAAGSKIGTFTFATIVTTAAGERIQVVAPITPDGAMSDLELALVGTR